MKYDDLKELGDSYLRYNITHFSEHDGICTMNGMIPIPVDAVSFSYEGDEDIEIYDEKGNYLGVLCICKAISDININSITDARYIALNTIIKYNNRRNSTYASRFISPLDIPKNFIIGDADDFFLGDCCCLLDVGISR